MKSALIQLVILFACSSLSIAQIPTFTTDGNQIKSPCGEFFVMRGVNYSLADDWNFPANVYNGKELSKEIIKANPNTVRIQWYVDYGQPSRPALTLEALDSVISRFARAGIASMIELHDFTYTHHDTAAFNASGLTWWTSQPVIDLLNKHKSYLFLNVANEFGPAWYPGPAFNYNPNYNAQLPVWKTHQINIIKKLRAVGIELPIVIDGPNYSLDYTYVLNNGADLVNADPLKRVILSCHAYWSGTQNDMNNIVDQLSAASFPIILGEIGNVDAECNAIPYTDVLTRAQTKNLGWLAWTWNRDHCSARNMTANDPNGVNVPANDGLFSTLTAFGQTIVNTPEFGLATKAVKADFSCVTSIQEEEKLDWKIFPNPSSDFIYLENLNKSEIKSLKILNIDGKLIRILKSNSSSISIQDLADGLYILDIESAKGNFKARFIKQ